MIKDIKFTAGLLIEGRTNKHDHRSLRPLSLLNTDIVADTMVWSRPVTTGPLPSPRAGHAAVVVGGASGVLGEEWSQMGSTSWNDGPAKMLLFGGGDGSSYLNDVCCLDLNTLSWSTLQTGGTVPSPRSRHTMTLINEGRSVLMLGGGGDTHVYNDVYVLDVETMKWSRAACHGQVPFSRWGHTSLMLTDRHCLIYGGHDGQVMMNDMHVLDTHTWHWYQPQHLAPLAPGLAPSPRAGHTATLVQIGASRKVFVFGGGDGNKIFNDSYLLDVDTCLHACQSPSTSPRTGHVIWSKPHVKGSLPAARCAHTTTTIEGALVVFGGGDGSRRFKDVYVLDLNGLGDDNTQANLLLSDGTHQPSASIAINSTNSTAVTPVVPTSPRNHSPVNSEQSAPHSPQPNRNKPLKRSSSSSSLSPQSNLTPVPPSSSTPTDVVSWLGKIGMGKYSDMFVKEEIDMSLLPHLTEKHLSENLRVPTLGARLRILNAISALKEQSRGTPPVTTSPQPPSRDQLKIQQLESNMNKLVSLISEASTVVVERLAPRSNGTNTIGTILNNNIVNSSATTGCNLGPGCNSSACK